MLALAAQAHGQTAIPIAYLPYTISSPGTYVLATDLTAVPDSAAINVYQSVGYVVLNLKGHTLHMNGTNSYGITAHLSGGASGGITIENGTIEVAGYGIVANTNTPNKVTALVVQNVTFQNVTTSAEDVFLSQTNGVQIKNCRFVGVGRLGVLDEGSETGNTLSNLSFDGQLSVNLMEDGTPPLTVSETSHD